MATIRPLQPQAEVDFWDSLSPELQARLRCSQESFAAERTESLTDVFARLKEPDKCIHNRNAAIK